MPYNPVIPAVTGDCPVYCMVISNDEYADLVEAKTQLDLILDLAGETGYVCSDIIQAVKKSRRPVITAAVEQE